MSVGRVSKKVRKLLGPKATKKPHKHKPVKTGQYPRVSVRLAPTTGFREISAVAVYSKVDQHLLVTTSGAKTASNKGPGIFSREVVPWSRGDRSPGKVRAFLVNRLEGLAKQIQGRKYPESGMFLDQCYKGDDPSDFMCEVCPVCTCWYCEMKA